MPDIARKRDLQKARAAAADELASSSRSVIADGDPQGVLGTLDEHESRLAEAFEAGGRRYRFLAKAIPVIVWTATPEGKLDSFNTRWTEYTGQTSRQNRERGWHRSLHPEDVSRWADGWERSRSSRKTLSIDVRLRRADGSYRWHLARALPVQDRSGVVLKWLGICTDIDDQKRAEGMLGFLAEVSTVLASSLDYETTLAAVARVAVPHVADWCVVDMLEPDGSTRRLAVAHADPSQVKLGWEVARRYPPALGDPRAASQVLASDQSVITQVVDDAMLADSAQDADHLAMLRAQGCRSTVCVLLSARGRTLGVITFAMAESGRKYGPSDLPLVEDLARRAAMAADNARLYREAQLAREEAEAANRAKDRFLAVLSHELRTPLTPVLAEVAAMLEDPSTPESVRSVLEMTRRNVDLEARLIDDLLDISRIAQGKLRLNREVVDVHALIGQAVQICRSGIDEARILLDLEFGAIRHHAEADSARLQQVIWNLLKNAVKFTPKRGSIIIKTRNQADSLLVEVVDSGVGIDSESLPRIFDAFEQGRSTITQRFGGLGLGLAISQSLAEAHGGKITASSPGLGHGSTFLLELPLVEAPEQKGPLASSIELATPLAASIRILLVEDDADTLRIMARLLRSKGHEVATASSMLEALSQAEAHEFDLVVSDLGLPDGSGLDLIRQLRKIRPIAGIALSGYGMDEDIQRSREAGFFEHLTKPVRFPALEAAIGRVVTV